MRVLGIVGSVTDDSRTQRAIETALEGAEGESEDVETDVLHLAEYDLQTADGRGIEEYEGDTAAALDLVSESDAYVIGSPVYRAAYSGALKNLFDMIPRGMWQADVAPLANSAVGLVATGATDHHYLSIDEELRPVMSFFGAHTLGGSVYANDDHFEDREVVDEDVRDRLEMLGAATLEQAWSIEQSSYLSELGPQF